jgi:hypothetical protein
MPKQLFFPSLYDLFDAVNGQRVPDCLQPNPHLLVGDSVNEIHAEHNSVTFSVSPEDPLFYASLDSFPVVFQSGHFPRDLFRTTPVPPHVPQAL